MKIFELVCGWITDHEALETGISDDWVRPMSFTYLHYYSCICGKVSYEREVRHSKEMD